MEPIETQGAGKSGEGEPGRFVDADGLICDHVVCRGCGYDLMGLPVGGDCPECGKLIEGSRVEAVVRAELLEKTLEAGWWGNGETGACIVGCAALMRGVFVLSSGKPSAELVGVWVFFGLIGGYGWWLVTRVRPGFEGAVGLEAERMRARWAMLEGEVLAALWCVPMNTAGTHVMVYGVGALAVWWGAWELYKYWPRVIGEGFAGSRRAWGACYAGAMGALAVAVVGIGFGRAWPGFGWMVCLAVGGGCYLGALLILCSAGRRVWMAGRSPGSGV